MEKVGFNTYQLSNETLFHVTNVSTKTSGFDSEWFQAHNTGVRPFDPIHSSNGSRITCCYGALDDLTALNNEIIHHSGPTQYLNWRPQNPIENTEPMDRQLVQLRSKRVLNLIDINSIPEVSRQALWRHRLQLGEQGYPALQQLANWLVQHYAAHDGIFWREPTPKIQQHKGSIMLFGHRVTNENFELIKRQSLNSIEILMRIRELVRIKNVQVPRWLIEG